MGEGRTTLMPAARCMVFRCRRPPHATVNGLLLCYPHGRMELDTSILPILNRKHRGIARRTINHWLDRCMSDRPRRRR